MRHLREIDDLSSAELEEVLRRSEVPAPADLLRGQGIALYFEKPSLRTRHSAEMAAVQLGAHPLTMMRDEIGPGSRESLTDMARVLAGYHSVFGARVYHDRDIDELCTADALPIVNLLTNNSHPVQALADLLTAKQEFGRLEGRTLCWVGDFNNVARSLALGAALTGMEVRLACPDGFGPSPDDVERMARHGATPIVTDSVDDAAKGAHVVETDVWTSMGFEDEAAHRTEKLSAYRVTAETMSAAAEDAIFLHCMPVHREQEVTTEVADGPRSRVVRQAHNRLPTIRALFWWLVEANR